MAKVNAFTGLYSLQARGKYGEPNGFGLTKFGWSHFGVYNLKAGYYQLHRNPKTKHWIRAKHYWNPPHTTEKALAWKDKFRTGVSLWHALAPIEKLAYNKRRYPYAQSGFTRFMSEYLKSVR